MSPKLQDNVWVMAFDFGEARIGIAIGNTLLKIPHPLVTVTGRNKFEKIDKIAKLVGEWQPRQLVVGMPGQPIGKEQLITNITRFANRLSHKFKVPHVFVNEDYSSSIAQTQLSQQHVRHDAQKGKLDQLAACAILEQYFSRVCENDKNIEKCKE